MEVHRRKSRPIREPAIVVTQMLGTKKWAWMFPSSCFHAMHQQSHALDLARGHAYHAVGESSLLAWQLPSGSFRTCGALLCQLQSNGIAFSWICASFAWSYSNPSGTIPCYGRPHLGTMGWKKSNPRGRKFILNREDFQG